MVSEKLKECTGAPVDLDSFSISRTGNAIHSFSQGFSSFKRQPKDCKQPYVDAKLLDDPEKLAHYLSQVNKEIEILSSAAAKFGLTLTSSPKGSLFLHHCKDAGLSLSMTSTALSTTSPNTVLRQKELNLQAVEDSIPVSNFSSFAFVATTSLPRAQKEGEWKPVRRGKRLKVKEGLKDVSQSNLENPNTDGREILIRLQPIPPSSSSPLSSNVPGSRGEMDPVWPVSLALAPSEGVAALRIQFDSDPTSEYASICSVNGHEVGTYLLPSDPNLIIGSASKARARNKILAEKVAQIANENREILFALANTVMICQNVKKCWWDGGNILEAFLVNLERVGIANHLIGVLDDDTETYLVERAAKRSKRDASPINATSHTDGAQGGRNGSSGSGSTIFEIHWIRLSEKDLPKAQKGSREANIVSSLKFTIVQELMQMGYHTLLSDMDLVYVQNPFNFLHRDADVESSSDGFDDMAYGLMSSIQDASMGWGGGGLYMQTFTLNVGCAYLRATQKAYALVRRVSGILASQPGWDQQIFNQALLMMPHGGNQREGHHPGGTPSIRIMSLTQFVNSKTFFRSRRKEYLPGRSASAQTPVMVHFNYHPDKFKRMECVTKRYFEGVVDACDSFPGGSEPNT
eukprot:CAMPEP_0175075950 /NCGR_PEP_ID=MMETSP0052_2-20121109/22390_1 /TAXON_ID=51329 ORGANISM="Polytomella parva, Strain SAG 63-3" /NCGR_SAMPLE_ID=MMETSP0052_2 /ASSEMBLY_ACC=CAM_ASM_000194 /LENGTH=631 /DNA_ID=CAMNT_0016344903 /DNA_START=397 /DNA_END=2292 /DNA_ORIENTATION=-